MTHTRPRLLEAFLGWSLMALVAGCGGSSGGGGGSGGLIPLGDDSEMSSWGIAEPPTMDIGPERPFSGSTVYINVRFDGEVGPAGITLSHEGIGCGQWTSGEGENSGQAQAIAGAFGSCRVVATAIVDGEEATAQGKFVVQATNPPVPPVDILGALYSADPLPEGSSSGPSLSGGAIHGPDVFINGGTSRYTVELGSSGATALLIGIQGFQGHYFLPARPEATSLSFDARFSPDIAEELEERGGSGLTLELVPVDPWGRTGSTLNQVVQMLEVGDGQVRVGISWDSDSDVDLAVQEPGGEVINWNQLTSSSGGQLDLDSNANCALDGINSENIFWPDGQSPAGSYTVQVDMFSTCGTGQATGTLQASFCGEGSPLIDSFELEDGDQKQWTFSSDCGAVAASVSGVVLYEDFEISRLGRSSEGVFVPSRAVTVQVVRASDGALLGEGVTSRTGEFSIDFGSSDGAGYKLRVLAHIGGDNLFQRVLNDNDVVWTWESSESYDETQVPNNQDRVLAINESAGAGALNILDVGYESAQYLRTLLGPVGWPITWRWSPNRTGGAWAYSSDDALAPEDSYGLISINGLSPDGNEYNDTVLAHEFGHIAHAMMGRHDSPGGSHSLHERLDPRLAWSEGFAHFFGALALDTSTYVKTSHDGTVVDFAFSLEEPYRPIHLPDGSIVEVPMGFSHGWLPGEDLDGDLSELAVAGLLWDIHDDSTYGEIFPFIPVDRMKNQEWAAFAVQLVYLESGYAGFIDRGVDGRDLVDFLDGWVCWLPSFGEDDPGTEDLEDLVVFHSMPYDFTEAEEACSQR